MNFPRLLILLAIAGGSYQYWKTHHALGSADEVAASAESANGFESLPPVAGERADAVLVVAAEDCPHDDARRADALAGDLSARGIPVVRTHRVSFNLTSPDESATARITRVMNSGLPIVFVHGRAKSNPNLDEVIAEYRSETR